MLRVGSGISTDADEAALAALLPVGEASAVLVFASRHYELAPTVAAVAGLAGRALVTGCVGPAVATHAGAVEGPAVAVLALGGDGFLLRPAQAPRGQVDGRLLVRELGAPRGGRAIVVLPGEAVELDGEGLPVFGTGPVHATAIGPEVEPGGTLAWLLAGEWGLVQAGQAKFGLGLGVAPIGGAPGIGLLGAGGSGVFWGG